jgi:hypothetical protein
MRRDFALPESDTDYLDSLGLKWETFSCEGNWAIVHDYPLPGGYNVQHASLGLKIDPGYPVSQIDMVYFSPHIHRTDGKSIGALAMQIINGTQWQRWSRHRTAANPWRVGVDEIATHLILIQHWLEREFQIR